jgi:hypothetical protein
VRSRISLLAPAIGHLDLALDMFMGEAGVLSHLDVHESEESVRKFVDN